MKTGKEYVNSIQSMKMHIFSMSQEYSTSIGNPLLQPSVNSVKLTYDLALDPNYANLLTAKSISSNIIINRFNHIHQSTNDLINVSSITA